VKDETKDGIAWMGREIERLRTERDCARREVCWILAGRSDQASRYKAKFFAKYRGWDCFSDDVEQLRARLVKELYSGEG